MTTDEVAGELTGLADLLERIDAWDAPSLCPGWSVRDVVAHITLPVHASPLTVLGGLARSGFRWNAYAARRARHDGARPPAVLLAALRDPRMHRWTPKGGGTTGALVHAVVHGLDITEALSVERPLPPERLRLVLDGLTATASLRHFGVRLDGVALRADDVDWRHGEGQVVRAPAVELVLRLSGRRPLVPDPEVSASRGRAGSRHASTDVARQEGRPGHRRP